MVPRAEIISIEKNQKIKEILEIIKHESHSRMPVYDQNLDNALGFFHIKEKQPIMVRNIRNIFHRAQLTDQEVRTLRGVISSLENNFSKKN